MENQVTKIGTLTFNDLEINVYHDIYSNKESVNVCWQVRNGKSFYEGIVYYNCETNKITYPEGAIIPIQTEQDKEIIPKFIIVGVPELSEDIKLKIIEYLEIEHKKRNGFQ